MTDHDGWQMEQDEDAGGQGPGETRQILGGSWSERDSVTEGLTWMIAAKLQGQLEQEGVSRRTERREMRLWLLREEGRIQMRGWPQVVAVGCAGRRKMWRRRRAQGHAVRPQKS
jgi:hypothetical protein